MRYRQLFSFVLAAMVMFLLGGCAQPLESYREDMLALSGRYQRIQIDLEQNTMAQLEYTAAEDRVNVLTKALENSVTQLEVIDRDLSKMRPPENFREFQEALTHLIRGEIRLMKAVVEATKQGHREGTAEAFYALMSHYDAAWASLRLAMTNTRLDPGSYWAYMREE
jgi:hypothetical protein